MKSIILVFTLLASSLAFAKGDGPRLNVEFLKNSEGKKVLMYLTHKDPSNGGIDSLIGVKRRVSCTGGVHSSSNCQYIYSKEYNKEGTYVWASVSMDRRWQSNKSLSLTVETNLGDISMETGNELVISVPNLTEAVGLPEFKVQLGHEQFVYSCDEANKCKMAYTHLFGFDVEEYLD